MSALSIVSRLALASALIAGALAGPAAAKFGPRPVPDANPNPPTSDADKRLVQAADGALNRLLADPKKAPSPPATLFSGLRDLHHLGAMVELKHLHVVTPSALPAGMASATLDGLEVRLKQLSARGELDSGSRRGTALGTTEALYLPQGRHLVRAWARFDGKFGGWRRVDIVLEEDAGDLALRHIFATPMRSDLTPPIVVRTGAAPVCAESISWANRPHTPCIGADKRQLWAPRIHFETAKYKLKPRALPILADVAAVLKLTPAIVELEIQGHSDARGSHRYGLKLEQRRAEAVMQALLDFGVERKRLRAVGYGEDRPIAPNDTPENRRLNRRTDFVIRTWAEAR